MINVRLISFNVWKRILETITLRRVSKRKRIVLHHDRFDQIMIARLTKTIRLLAIKLQPSVGEIKEHFPLKKFRG